MDSEIIRKQLLTSRDAMTKDAQRMDIEILVLTRQLEQTKKKHAEISGRLAATEAIIALCPVPPEPTK